MFVKSDYTILLIVIGNIKNKFMAGWNGMTYISAAGQVLRTDVFSESAPVCILMDSMATTSERRKGKEI